MTAQELCRKAKQVLESAVPEGGAPFVLRLDGSLIINASLISPHDLSRILAKHGTLQRVPGSTFHRLPPGWQAPIPGTEFVERALKFLSSNSSRQDQPFVRPDGSIVLTIQEDIDSLAEFFQEDCHILPTDALRPHPMVIVLPQVFAKLVGDAPETLRQVIKPKELATPDKFALELSDERQRSRKPKATPLGLDSEVVRKKRNPGGVPKRPTLHRRAHSTTRVLAVDEVAHRTAKRSKDSSPKRRLAEWVSESPKAKRPTHRRTHSAPAPPLSFTDEPSPERPILPAATHGFSDNAELRTVLSELDHRGSDQYDYDTVCEAIERVRTVGYMSMCKASVHMLAEALWTSEGGPTRPTIERLVDNLTLYWDYDPDRERDARDALEEKLMWHFVLGSQNKEVERLVGTVTCSKCGGFKKRLQRTLPHVWSAHLGAEFDPAAPAIPTFSGLILDALKPSQEQVTKLVTEKQPLLAGLGVELPEDVHDLKVALCRCRCAFCGAKEKECTPIEVLKEQFPACKECREPVRKMPLGRRRFWTD